MTFTHALATNRYGEADLIVSTSAANGTHTTLASAMAAAVSGQTIFLRDSVTENVTITPGVNIHGWSGSALNIPSITGTLTMTGAGTSTISGVRLVTNSAALIAVTGSAASILNVFDCYLDITNNDGITFSSSSASALINIKDSTGNLGTTGIKIFAHTSAGTLSLLYSSIGNSGASVTASTITAGFFSAAFSTIASPITTSGTASFITHEFRIITNATNTLSLTIGGSGGNTILAGNISSGTATAVTTTDTLNMFGTKIGSSNAAAISGAGTLVYSDIAFVNTSSEITTTTVTGRVTNPGITRSAKQPAFLAYLPSDVADVTGAGATFNLGTGTALTEVFDQGNDFNTNGTFTAPLTGRYRLSASLQVKGITVAMTSESLAIATSNGTYTIALLNPNSGPSTTVGCILSGDVLLDMDAADTAIVAVTVANGAGNTADIGGTSGTQRTYFSGNLVC